jgi:pyruvate/2-oxoglutarate dehydrogenase complex dihydrolipoamide dehydrogenase (E3) component
MDRYRSLGVDCFKGDAEVISPYEVKMAGRTFTTKNIVIATGAEPRLPSVPGLSDLAHLTSENLWSLNELPARLLVVGGGAIGCEMAQAFSLLGSEVTLLESGSRLLMKEDVEVSSFIEKKFTSEGLRVLTQHHLVRFQSTGGRDSAFVQAKNGPEKEICFDRVLVASGRKARLEGFGLDKIGVQIENGSLALDPFLRTNFPNILACGDVTGQYQFTHAASHEAWFVAVNALFSPFKKFKLHYKAFPWVTYTFPEIARVGLNEIEAREKKIDYEVTRYDLADLDRAITDSEAQGFVKVITPGGKDKILGVTIVGAHAGETLAEFVLAMRWGLGLGLGKVLSTIHPYPTLSEANKFAAGVWRKNHAPATVLKWLAKFHQWRRNGP